MSDHIQFGVSAADETRRQSQEATRAHQAAIERATRENWEASQRKFQESLARLDAARQQSQVAGARAREEVEAQIRARLDPALLARLDEATRHLAETHQQHVEAQQAITVHTARHPSSEEEEHYLEE